MGFIQNLLQDAVKTVKTEGTNAVQAFFGTEYLRDYTHASKTFRTNSYQYSPKFKFLFHVYFDINKEYISAVQSFPEDSNFGLTVKNIQLPKYTFDTTIMNQYNRKRVVQTKINYDPVNISFHDDNGNLLRRLWYTYYTYYYKDATQSEPFGENRQDSHARKFDMNRRNIYDPDMGGNDDWGYIGESSGDQKTPIAASLGISKAPFFKAINIYGFNQHNFVLYRLINPMIENFSHDTYDYSQGNGVMENQMTLQYETVKYYEGAIDGRSPDAIVKGFGSDATYDRTLSPIARPGSQATILGQGGLVDAAGGILEDLESGNFRGAIQKAGASYNTFKNPQTLLNAARSEITGIANDAITNRPNSSARSYFPTFGSSSTNKNTSTTKNGANTGATQPKTPTFL
jgi:hypothetical protein